MSLREELLKEYSKPYTVYLANRIGANQDSFDGLIDLFLGDEYRVTQRAAWVISHCADARPWLVEKHIQCLLENLQKPVHDAVKRNTVRVLQFVEIPEDLMGMAAEICFNYLNSGKEPIAIKVHSMSVLLNIVKKFPELKDELKIAIEEQLPFGSAGFINRGTKILKSLAKM